MIRISHLVCVVSLLAVSAPVLADGTTPPAADPKLDLAVTLVNESGISDQIKAVVDRNLHDDMATQKKAHPEIPDRYWDAYKSEFHEYYGAHKDELIRKVAAVYASRLSETELRAAIAFYETEAGKKLADAAVPAEIGDVVEQWGNDSANTVEAKVQNSMQGRQ